MAETLVERCCFVLQGLSREIFGRVLPEKEPNYPAVMSVLVKLLESKELNSHADAVLISHINGIFAYGGKWENVYPILLGKTADKAKNKENYKDTISEIIRLLEQKIPRPAVAMQLSFIEKLEQDMKFYKVIIPGFVNESTGIDEELVIASIARMPDFRIKTEQGDPRTYLHNPLRERIVFVKQERLRGERFSSYLVPFMKRNRLSLYLCPIETMLGYLAKKYGNKGVFNLVAVSKKKLLKSLDDRTLFIVLEKTGNGYIPLEFCFGGIIHRVPLIMMETLAFGAGLRPDEIARITVNDEFEKVVEEYTYKILDPSRVALIGWWHNAFRRIIELYFIQNLQRAFAEFIFYISEFLAEKGAMEHPAETNIFKAAIMNEFSLDDAIFKGSTKSGPFSLDLRTQFYNFLQTPHSEGFTEESADYTIELLISIATLTEFDPDPEKNKSMQEQEIKDLTNMSRYVHPAEKTFAFYKRIQRAGVRRAMFTGKSYALIKNAMREINSIFKQPNTEEMIKKALDPAFSNELIIDIDNVRFYAFAFPPVPWKPIEVQAEELINRGFKTLIFYGTSAGIIEDPAGIIEGEVKGVPKESLVIPEVMYIHPKQYRIDPEQYVPLPVQNILLADKSASNYFNTDNFYKTHNLYVTAQFQEHAGFLKSIYSVFKGKQVSLEMDIAPLAELCVEKGVGFGAILFATDELAGVEERQRLKGYYMRQLILSLLRGYEGKKLLINGQPVEAGFNDAFRTLIYFILKQRLHRV